MNQSAVLSASMVPAAGLPWLWVVALVDLLVCCSYCGFSSSSLKLLSIFTVKPLDFCARKEPAWLKSTMQKTPARLHAQVCVYTLLLQHYHCISISVCFLQQPV